jgi:DNA-binding transcriptional regulator WhiA
MRGYFRKNVINGNKSLQAYVVGLAIGDGNLSNPNGRATRLRITCDNKYPLLMQHIICVLESLLPLNKVSCSEQKHGCADVSVYSNHLEGLLGWTARGGSKFKQKVSIPKWILKNNAYKINCLRGLIETDGSIYFDRGYKMVIFKTIISKLANDFYDMLTSLGFKPKIYKIKANKENAYGFHQKTAYHVRLSKDVNEFLNLVKPEKK